jgi:hypothetical protein
LDTLPDFETSSGSIYTTLDVVEEMRRCFPGFREVDPSVDEVLLMREIIAKCDDFCMYPRTAMEYAKKHKRNPKDAALIPRSIKQLHKAICGKDVSTTNGLLAQTKEHDPRNCGTCLMEIRNKACARCGKTPVVLAPDGTANYCGNCNSLPTYRRESGRSNYLTAEGGANVL